MIIGLTGGIACGKTTVAAVLKRKSAAVLDADKFAKDIVQKGTNAYNEIISAFGAEILDENGDIDRRALGSLVFNNMEYKKILEGIIHPRVIERMEVEAQNIKKEYPNKIVVFDVPLLFEAGMQDKVDQVWVVAASEETQLKRIMNRRPLTRKEALDRIKSQMPIEEKVKFADVVIYNEGSLEELEEKVKYYWDKYVSS